MNQLAKIQQEQAGLLAQQQEVAGRAMLLNAVATGNMNPENARVAMDLYKEMQAMDAKKQFAVAFAALQAEMPRIKATKIIPDNDNNTRSVFAPYEEIMRQLTPVLEKHGFSVRFDAESDDKRITAICHLSHVGGHETKCQFACRLSAPPKTSAAQADGATLSYAKRYALCNMFNIAVAQDDDARLLGDYITPEQAEGLRTRLARLRPDPAPFLKFAHADSFEKIRAGRYAECEAFILKAERKATQSSPHDPGATGPTGAPGHRAASDTATSAADASSASPDAAAKSNAGGVGGKTQGAPMDAHGVTPSFESDTGADVSSAPAPKVESGKGPAAQDKGGAADTGPASPPKKGGRPKASYCNNCGSKLEAGKPCEVCAQQRQNEPSMGVDQAETVSPEIVADAFARETPLPALTSWLMRLTPAHREKAMQTAGLDTLVDAEQEDVRNAAYNAKLAELASGKTRHE